MAFFDVHEVKSREPEKVHCPEIADCFYGTRPETGQPINGTHKYLASVHCHANFVRPHANVPGLGLSLYCMAASFVAYFRL
jgi:hypothetical protein